MHDKFTFPAPSDAKKLTEAKLRVDALVAEMKALPEVKSVSDEALYAIAIMIEGRTWPASDAFVGIGLKNIRERGNKPDSVFVPPSGLVGNPAPILPTAANAPQLDHAARNPPSTPLVDHSAPATPATPRPNVP